MKIPERLFIIKCLSIGVPGRAGADGIPGKDGKDGVHGADGKNGKDGKDGSPGPIGPPGQMGSQGLRGMSSIFITSIFLVLFDHELAINKSIHVIGSKTFFVTIAKLKIKNIFS